MTLPEGLPSAFREDVMRLEKAERRGDLAELRRLDPEVPDRPAFYRIIARRAPEAGVEAMRDYAHILRILALGPERLTDDGAGRVMADCAVSESRVQKLLSSRGKALRSQVQMLAGRLARDGRVPWRDFSELVLADRDDDRIDRVRMRIARDFWTALDRRTSSGSSEPASAE